MPISELAKVFSNLKSGVILTLFGVLFVGIGLFIRNAMVPSPSVSATGTVVDIATVQGRRGSVGYSAVVEFPGPNSQVIRFQEPSSSNITPYRRGQQVTVLYDPQNSEIAVIDSPFTWLPITIFIAFGVISLVIGLLALLNVLLIALKLGGLLSLLAFWVLRRKSPG